MTINRKIIYLLSMVATLILFGCTKKEQVTYHSTASISHSIQSDLTIMKYIKLDESLFSQRLPIGWEKDYGVATAVDIKEDASQVGYVLFAPSTSRRNLSVKKLSDMWMNMSVPLTADQTKILSSKLKFLAGNWGKEMEEDGGIFYEFSITPEHERIRLSENVILEHHVFKLTFSQFPKGKSPFNSPKSVTSVNLTMGRDHYSKTIKIDKIINLQALIYLLDQAVEDIESRFGNEFQLPMKRETL